MMGAIRVDANGDRTILITCGLLLVVVVVGNERLVRVSSSNPDPAGCCCCRLWSEKEEDSRTVRTVGRRTMGLLPSYHH